MPKTDAPRIAILGAGPIGLEAALVARQHQFPVTVYERGRVGEHPHRWGHLRLFSPFGMNSTPAGRSAIVNDYPGHEFPADAACITANEHIGVYLDPLSQTSLLKTCVRVNTKVIHVARAGYLKEEGLGDPKRADAPFRLLIQEGKNRERVEEANIVLDCTGTYSRHRWLGDGGIPAIGEEAAEPNISYGLENVLGTRRSFYAGRNIMVIGGGYSAATSVCQLATLAEDQPDTWVIWLARCAGTQPIPRIPNDPLKERDRLAVRANSLATRGDGNVEFHNQTVVDVIDFNGPDKGFRIGARCAGKPKTWEVDRVIANVGFTPHTVLYRELQVHECYATLAPINLAAALLQQQSHDCLDLKTGGANTLKNPEPNFFILGAKSYGRNSHFLLRTGFDQVKEVFSLLTEKR